MKKNKKFSMNEDELTIELLTNELTWDEISKKQLTINFIDKNKEYLNWKEVSKSNKLTTTFIDKYSDCVDWNMVCLFGYIDDYIFDNYFEELYTNNLFLVIFNSNTNVSITCDLLDKYSELDYFDDKMFSEISKYKNLTEKYINKYHEKLNWNNLVRTHDLSENLITKYFSIINFDNMNFKLCSCKLSNEYIKKYIINKLSNRKIINELNNLNSKIDLKLLKDYNNKELWDIIAGQYNYFNEVLIKKYKDKLNKNRLLRNLDIMMNPYLQKSIEKIYG